RRHYHHTKRQSRDDGPHRYSLLPTPYSLLPTPCPSTGGARKVALPRADTVIAAVLPDHFHVDFSPRPVGLRVRRNVAERVLGADVGEHFIVHAVELLPRQRKERLTAGDVGNLLEQHPLLIFSGGRLVFERADGVHGHV